MIYPTVFSRTLILAFVATIATQLRLYSRRKSKLKLGWDDHFAVIAVILAWADTGILLKGAVSGTLSIVPADISHAELPEVLKENLACHLVSALCLTFCRFSLLCLYHRLFSVVTWFRNTLKVFAVLSILWYIAYFSAESFRCKPIRAVTDPTLPGATCLEYVPIYNAMEGLNLFLNFALEVMPIVLIRGLHLPLRDRILVSGIFLIGLFICSISAVRMILALQFDTVFSDSLYYPACYWLSFQITFCIIAVNVPTYRPLIPSLSTITYHRFWPKSWVSSSRSSRWRTSITKGPSDVYKSEERDGSEKGVDSPSVSSVGRAHGAGWTQVHV